MKKFLLAFAAVALSGCAYSQYKADSLQTYAVYDCSNLQAEQRIVEFTIQQDQQRKRRKGFQWSVSFTGPTPMVRDYSPSPARKRRMLQRFQNHARLNAILELQTSQGCQKG